MKPQIATLLSDGTYGQRDMTDEELTEYETIQSSIIESSEVDRPAYEPAPTIEEEIPTE